MHQIRQGGTQAPPASRSGFGTGVFQIALQRPEDGPAGLVLSVPRIPAEADSTGDCEGGSAASSATRSGNQSKESPECFKRDQRIIPAIGGRDHDARGAKIDPQLHPLMVSIPALHLEDRPETRLSAHHKFVGLLHALQWKHFVHRPDAAQHAERERLLRIDRSSGSPTFD